MVHDFLLSNKIIRFIIYLANVMKFDIHSASPSISMWRPTYIHSTVHSYSEEQLMLYKAVKLDQE